MIRGSRVVHGGPSSTEAAVLTAVVEVGRIDREATGSSRVKRDRASPPYGGHRLVVGQEWHGQPPLVSHQRDQRSRGQATAVIPLPVVPGGPRPQERVLENGVAQEGPVREADPQVPYDCATRSLGRGPSGIVFPEPLFYRALAIAKHRL